MSTSSPSSKYIGRFAPTPTGPLHFGSLVAALASYLDAKAHQGEWLLRIEDLDPPREDPSASEFIPKQLLAHGLQWDRDISHQSLQTQAYENALETLRSQSLLFPCTCSRKQLANQNGLHKGDCHSDISQPHSWRLPVPDENWSFDDPVYGQFQQNLLQEVGDQVLKRKDGLYAYQLAVVVDDHLSGINHVVRGVDLLDNTPRQIYLQKCLGYHTPNHLHLPLIVNEQGQKLSKQNQAAAVNLDTPETNLIEALKFLNQPLPSQTGLSIQDILNWGIKHWTPNTIQAHREGIIPQGNWLT